MTLTTEQLQTVLALRPFRFYPQVNSTNDIARDWLRADAPLGAVVIADEQLRGRGRQGRVWHTPPGVALAVSVILRPSPEALPRLSMLGALAIAELAEQVGAQEVAIKWPNDVQIQGLKVSGVLPEVEWDGARLVGAVLGMGVNVRADFSGTELDGRAISLEMAVGQTLDRTQLVKMLLDRVDFWYGLIESDALFEAWHNRLSTLGQPVSSQGVTGVAESVDAGGALLVRDVHGEIRRVIAGDLVMG